MIILVAASLALALASHVGIVLSKPGADFLFLMFAVCNLTILVIGMHNEMVAGKGKPPRGGGGKP